MGLAGTRVGDSEREAAAALLREQYAAGTLTWEEFQDRLHAVYDAQVYADLAAVTADLPSASRVGAVVQSVRSAARRALLGALTVTGGILAVVVVIAVLVPHGALLALLLGLLLVPVLVIAALVAGAAWITRRAWRSGAWLEAVPIAAGMPWLGRVVWAARAALVGRACWRIGRRLRRPIRSRPASASYQDHPGGSWRQAKVSGAGRAPS
ncbi:MAG: DUF1707 domain-containing protein [Actinobacteria bacterium]|nr:DUF1707 domain-containing protein [Actinomycetota bacterium]